STYALTNLTLPYALTLAEQGLREAVRSDRALAQGVNTYGGSCTYEPVCQAHGLEYTPIEKML
ncbi:MAG: alanine dehydrogenase, partial [Actinomycetota bacterium]